MKIRCGFVSNSSSSSFLIYGASFKPIDSICDNLLKFYNEKYPDGKVDIEDIKDDFFEFLYSIDDYEPYTISYDDYYYLGSCPTTQPNDMTHGDWKEKIEKDLTNILGKYVLSFGWYEDCSYDG